MARPALRTTEIETFDERQFYLEEFRGHTLLFALPLRDLDTRGERELAALVRTLISNSTRIILLIDAGPTADLELVQRVLKRRLQPLILKEDTLPLFREPKRKHRNFAIVAHDSFATSNGITALLSTVWSGLRQGPLFVGISRHSDDDAALSAAVQLASRLRVQKLVVLQPEGGLGADGQRISFMDAATMAALLTAGEAEWAGLGARRNAVALLRQALLGGVGSANLCTLPDAARELFTYVGSGTLFTLEDYCRVERLAIDDYEEAEQLIERGQREGALKTRTPDEIADLLANSYGATIGAHHLAGICALVTAPYEQERAGEIVGLYTITRFKGEGVGVRLIEKTLEDARADGLAYVFATTTVDRAQLLFERCGFRSVSPDDVPAAKWRGYDPARKARVAVLRVDLRPAEVGVS